MSQINQRTDVAGSGSRPSVVAQSRTQKLVSGMLQCPNMARLRDRWRAPTTAEVGGIGLEGRDNKHRPDVQGVLFASVLSRSEVKGCSAAALYQRIRGRWGAAFGKGITEPFAKLIEISQGKSLIIAIVRHVVMLCK
jgi:hypothetical protein